MSFDSNLYYSPEQFGLVPVAEIDYSDGCYQFDLRVVWRHDPTDKLYTARDSGCSCPSPFEDFHSLDDLELLDDIDYIEGELDQELRAEYGVYITAREAAEFRRAIEAEL